MSLSKSSRASSVVPKIHPPLDVPASSPRIAMNDPEFEKLTTAEKLNDRNYREIVYRTYPNELTCACEPEATICPGVGGNAKKRDDERSAGNAVVCRSGCKQKCCSSVRQPGVASCQRDNANENDEVSPAAVAATCCVESSRGNWYAEKIRKRKDHNGGHCGVENRLRGGGEGGKVGSDEGMYRQSEEVNRGTVRSFANAWNGGNVGVVDRRLEGGGAVGYEYVERYPVNRSPDTTGRTQCRAEKNLTNERPRTNRAEEHPRDSNLDTSHRRGQPSACASASEPRGPVAPGCCCPGRDTYGVSTGQRENGRGCARKPCPGVDCLIKTFRETQEFVESLGRVPGLAGLGLMDPGESPYFGRERTGDGRTRNPAPPTSGLEGLPNPRCTGPCNPEVSRPDVGAGVGRSPWATPFTIAVPGRGGVVREAVPALPGPGLSYPTGKSRRRDDKEKPKEGDADSSPLTEPEWGPCGEPGCKAKRRKTSPTEAPPPIEPTDDRAKKVVAHANINGGGSSRVANKAKAGSKTRSGRRSLEPGPGGDRTGMRTKSTGKSIRKKMRFVYSAGDTSAGFACGHKDCLDERRRVPWNMGWLWNLNQTVGRLKPRVGWKPGAIARHISEILREAKANPSVDHKSRPKTGSSASSRSRSRSAPSRGKRAKIPGDRRSVRKAPTKKNQEEEEEEPEPPPTLYIHRKDGTYYVTMYPIKQDTMDVPKLEVPTKPLQFKIAKNRDDASVATSSTASDMEIEFSPPAAVNRYRKRPNVVHVDTQVKQQEIIAAFKNDDVTKKEKKKGKKGKK